jgi:MYXO-CTERM domain-containing protein
MWALISTIVLAHAAPPPPPIVNGTEVEAGQWDDVALIWSRGDAWCTGVLVTSRVVLTAGHCIKGATHVSFGTDALDGARFKVRTKEAHPRWAKTYDVGVLVLENSPGVPETVVSSAELHDDAEAVIVGWGLIDRKARQETDFLREATIEVWDHDCLEWGWDCNCVVQPGGELVAGGTSDTCTGDSGGPVYQVTSDGPVLVGIVSRGISPSDDMCGDGGIYVRVDAVVDWVEATTGTEMSWDGYREPGSAEWSGSKRPGPPRGVPMGCSTAATSGGGWEAAGAFGLLSMGLVLARRREH